jgi:hypothetical protein
MTFLKMLVLLLVNLIAVCYLIYRLIKLGNPYKKALQVAWNIVVARINNPDYSISNNMVWASVLNKTWWATMFMFIVFWLVFQEWYFSCVIILLITIHTGWYLLGNFRQDSGFDRVLYLNSSWGIIYKTVTLDSGFIEKTLAELDLRKKNLLVLAIERNNQLVSFPKGTEVLGIGDRLVIFGDLCAYQILSN